MHRLPHFWKTEKTRNSEKSGRSTGIFVNSGMFDYKLKIGYIIYSQQKYVAKIKSTKNTQAARPAKHSYTNEMAPHNRKKGALVYNMEVCGQYLVANWRRHTSTSYTGVKKGIIRFAPIIKPGITAKKSPIKPKGVLRGSGRTAPVDVVVAALKCSYFMGFIEGVKKFLKTILNLVVAILVQLSLVKEKKESVELFYCSRRQFCSGRISISSAARDSFALDKAT
uniref:Uncharacterized protein n=1 Tax=Timema poppense TaxID=170557 RepID=A0A7R9CM38_TIMPO|nr:unnamed protein product [Timema poppensis]